MKIVLSLFCFIIVSVTSSQNLIQNPSFEDAEPNSYWSSNTSACFGFPVTICSKGNDSNENTINFSAWDGKNCVYLSLFECQTKWSDFIRQKIPVLVKGKTYQISFFITPSDSCFYYSTRIELLFCDYKIFEHNVSCSTPGKIKLKPTLSFDISTFKFTGEEGKWKKMTGEFVANGNENFLAVGNFWGVNKNSYTSTRVFNYKVNKKQLFDRCSADYYLDNFSLSEKTH